MTVGELIDALSQLPSGLPVMNGRAAEGGLDVVDGVHVLRAKLHGRGLPAYEGTHDIDWSGGGFAAAVLGMEDLRAR